MRSVIALFVGVGLSALALAAPQTAKQGAATAPPTVAPAEVTPTPTPTPAPAGSNEAAPTATPTPGAPTPTPVKPPAELARLQFLAGEWIHAEVHHGGPGGVSARGAARSKIAWVLGGHRLYIVYKSVGPGGEFEGRGLLGWDAAEKAYRLDWFDNQGLAQRYTGTFDPEEALVLSGEYSNNGERVRQQLTIKKQAGGKFLLLDESATGDQPPKPTLESLASPAPQVTPTPASGDAGKSTPLGEAGKGAPAGGASTGKGDGVATPTSTPTPGTSSPR
jgi:hypothetical protein